MALIVPPGGFAGFAQMTAAGQRALGTRSSSGRRRRRKSSKRKSTRKARKSGGRKLKFGSKAWRAKYNKKGRRRRRK